MRGWEDDETTTNLVVGAAALVAGIAVGDASPARADHGFAALSAVLTGAEEVPGPGDPDGIGAAGLLINTNRGRICWAVAVKNIEPAVVQHIHVGAAGVAGPVVVLLDPPATNGFSANCTRVDPALAKAIAANPAGYYVNVHNAPFPAGAVRGQLR